ncbi:LytTR family transcriptional regulator [Phaeobacter gallaeciensis]|uniref:LytTR family transcriptional regulator n=3 Tax=Roseobacteraceae TaxID=2854170 RepID=A0A366X9H4_9RHOB|nr:LytTR family DNA-binding domain-containing protein [Phaeobacter gallaeciensis]MBT3142692.1 LytTR family transcriptional regulator [Falsiruegeria litorea]MBT8168216.1 LytTR family transcriptional regulator [Falsiruegeria litorea]RBW61553.1 LytTR family transcriptional regulator [Phaeobacter gallaeciensis]
MSPSMKTLLSSSILRILVPGLAFVVLLANQAAPFAEEEASFGLRLVFWLLVIGGAGGLTRLAQALIQRHCNSLDQLAQDALVVALITCFLIPFLWVIGWLFLFSVDEGGPGLLQIAQWAGLFATGLLVLRRCFPAEKAPSPTTKLQQRPRLVRRLPQNLDAQILRLTVRDHCVDVVTSAGTHTIRSRFVDAIQEMEPIEGHCTHRSHWVTQAAIESIERHAGKIQIRLINGDLVPVSRKYKPDLEKAGLL